MNCPLCRILLLTLLLPACGALPVTDTAGDAADKGVGGITPEPEAAPLPQAPPAAPRVPAVVALLALANDERAAGRDEQATVTLERAVRIQPRDPQPWLELARIYFDAGDFDAAAQFAGKAARLAGPGDGLRQQAAELAAAARRAAN